ncbi:xylulokinase [Candidatus Bathyarchaeota archaeon]|nr:xylulokinase [Candidatus Bathyarchaeota archaeon]
MYLMGLDLSTSSIKVLIVDEEGNVIARSSEEYPIYSPLHDYAEQDPDLWWDAAKTSIKAALKSSGLKPSEISAVGLSGQMHGTVLIGRDMKPLRPAIIWSDKRSTSQCDEFYEIIGRERVLSMVCNPVMPGFMGPTLLWIKDNENRIFNSIFRVLLPKDYIRHKLTGIIATDFSDASATLLFDVRRRMWSDEIISALNLSREAFPEAFESTSVVGSISKKASEETGLHAGTPVVAGAGDSQAGAVGCGVIKAGIASSNIGTGGQIFTTLDELIVDPKNRVHTFCHAVPNKWCLQGAILSAGLSLRWFRDNFAHMEKVVGSSSNIDPYDLLSKEAEKAEPGCNGLIFLPYLLGERSPHMDPKAKGGFFGLTLQHSRQHFIRAIMEGVVYALRDCLEIFRELGVKIGKIIARGGGSRSNLWRQIQSDIFSSTIIKTGVEEDSAFGAALLAGVGVGIYPSLEKACAEAVKTVSVNEPDEERVKIYERTYSKVYRNLYSSLKNYWL